MNSLSWLIYLANVVGNAVVVLWLIIAAVAITSLVCLLYGGACKDFSYSQEAKKWIFGNNLQKKTLKTGSPILIGLMVLAVFVPSSSTVYAIAASEMGERALNTPTAGKAVKALNAWLDRQITDVTDEHEQEK